jgi:hypothetical protein
MARNKAAAMEDARKSTYRASGEAEPVPPRVEGTVTVHVPMTFARRGGRKRMLAPDGKPMMPASQPATADTPVVRAIARAFRWRRMIEAGEYATVREVAEAERVNASYVSRVLRLTLLAPEILVSLIDGHVAQVDRPVEVLLEPFAVGWQEQMRVFSKLADRTRLRPWDRIATAEVQPDTRAPAIRVA